MKRIKVFLTILLSLSLCLQQNMIIFADNDDITIHKTTEPTDENRVFEVTYTIESTPKQQEVDLLIVLDRSNSMLYLDKFGNRISESVRQQVIDFINDVYMERPNTRIGILSFGSNANKKDNWKYCDSKQDAIDEVNFIYALSYSHKKHGYQVRFRNFNYNDGATDIKEGFEQADKTIWQDNKHNPNNSVDTIVLFTDGVATRGGYNYDKDKNTPQQHNSNTLAAINAAQEAMENGVVFTIGYFEGISNYQTKRIAQDTLKQSQNGGYYDASTLNQISDILDSISHNLNYVGTDAVLSDVLADEFEVVEGSFSEGANVDVSITSGGQQQVDWHVGTLGEEVKKLTFKIRAKDDAYPTGKENIPTSITSYLSYDDEDGTSQTRSINENTVNLPPLDDQPSVSIDITHDVSEHPGYLVGDEITITNNLSFTNINPFDFTNIAIGSYTKKLVEGQLSDVFTVLDKEQNQNWIVNDNQLTYSINENHVLTTTPTWNKSIPLILRSNKEGNYTFKHDLDYELTNPYDNTFNKVLENISPDSINIRKGQLTVSLVDLLGNGIADQSIEIIGDNLGTINQNVITNSEGKAIVDLSTDTYTIKFPIPSGYSLAPGQSGVTLDDENYVNLTTSLNYNNPTRDLSVSFKTLTVRDIKVTTDDGSSNTVLDIENVPSSINAKVSFTTLNAFNSLTLVLDNGMTYAFREVKEKSSGNSVDGFLMNNNRIIYNGDQVLQPNEYEAYITIILPDAADVSINTQHNIGVNEVIYNSISDSVISERLKIDYTDNTGPLINTNIEMKSLQEAEVSVEIISTGTSIVEYKCAAGLLEESDFAAISNVGLKDIELSPESNPNTITAKFTVEKLLDDAEKVMDGYFEGSGTYTIYAKDEAGNEIVITVEINLADILPDLT